MGIFIGIIIVIIMTAAGFDCFSTGDVGAGLLLLLPVIIIATLGVIKIVKEVKRKRDLKRSWKEREEESHQNKLAEERRKSDAVKQQKELTERYKNGPLIKDVLRVISGGNSHASTPERIIIEDNRIQGFVNGQAFTYDFAANRVSRLPSVCQAIRDGEELKYVVKPQIAMANAINSLLGSKYEIYDNAKQDYHLDTDSDGDSHVWISYASDHVVMVLKSTLPNKSF